MRVLPVLAAVSPAAVMELLPLAPSLIVTVPPDNVVSVTVTVLLPAARVMQPLVLSLFHHHFLLLVGLPVLLPHHHFHRLLVLELDRDHREDIGECLVRMKLPKPRIVKANSGVDHPSS